MKRKKERMRERERERKRERKKERGRIVHHVHVHTRSHTRVRTRANRRHTQTCDTRATYLQVGQVDVLGPVIYGAFDGGRDVAADLPHEAEVSVVENVFVPDELVVVLGNPVA